MNATATTTTVHVFRTFIKAPAARVWEAITDPEWNHRYGYRTPCYYELRVGGSYRSLANQAMRDQGSPEVILEGEVLELDPPRRLVQTWHANFSEETRADAVTRLTWELDEAPKGITRLTVTHDLTGAPATTPFVTGQLETAGGGWAMIISDLKTMLETGASMAG